MTRKVWQPWTAAETRILIREWGTMPLEALAAKLQRTPLAVRNRALRILKLAPGKPEGMEYVTCAAERCGFSVPALRRILREHRVQTARPSSHTEASPCLWVDPVEVDDAIAAWCETESVLAASARLGVEKTALRKWLIDAGHNAPARGKTWRLRTEVFDEVVNARRMARGGWTAEEDELLRNEWGKLPLRVLASKLNRSMPVVSHRATSKLQLSSGIPAGKESVHQSAKRCGFSQETMRNILLAYGVELHRYTPDAVTHHRYWVDPREADKSVAAWLDTEMAWEAAQRLGVQTKELVQWLIEAGYSPPEKRPWLWRLPSFVFEAVVRKVA